MKNHLLKSVIVTFFLWIDGTHGFAQKNTSFHTGEELTFKVSYGFLDAAEAKMIIAPQVMFIDNKPTYKIDVYGETLGIFKLFYVKDNWGSYLDTTKIIPYQSYRHIEEGKYRKHEQVLFDHEKNKAHVMLYDRENKHLVDTKEYKIPSNVQDIVSGFYFLRTMDLKKLKKGDSVTLTGFFDKEVYHLKLLYEGKESIKTKIGSFETFVFSPVIPKNKIFRGEQPVKVWVTNDNNKIPVKIKAKLVVGSLDMEIIDTNGLRNN
ncbi:DUF3108 domain-containing protein [Shivajiella indica]|uniref:DUF3108 domain-containing protein n=1 Tax=Shivajiella indica TaxID=872115 RepID=A0ABW5BAM7_9BACT